MYTLVDDNESISHSLKKHIEIIPGTDCNFDCVYCYERPFVSNARNKMSSETIAASISYIMREYAANPKYHQAPNVFALSFFGGEPLLYCDVIDQFVDHLYSFNIKFRLISNGSLIQQKQDYILKWKKLLSDRLSFGISFDYALQEVNRCKHSKDKILANLLWLDDQDIRFNTNSVFTQHDLPKFSDVFQQYVHLQTKLKHKFGFRFGIDNLNYCGYDTEYRITVPSNLTNVHFKYGKIGKYNNRLHSCGWGNRVIAGLNWDGKLYPCQGAIFDSNNKLTCFGSVFDDFEQIQKSKHDVYNIFKRKINDSCARCEAVCKICPLETIQGDVSEFDTMPGEQHCKLQKFITKALRL